MATAGQPAEALGGAGDPIVVGCTRDPHADEHGPGQCRVACVVRSGQPQRGRPGGLTCDLGRRDPAQVRAEERCMRTEQLVGAVGEGEPDAGLGAQRELVGVVALDRAVPVEVIGREGGHRDHMGRGDDVGHLEARRLDHPVVGRGLGRGVPGRMADVPPGAGPVAEAGEEMDRQGRRRALPLGPGDAGHAGRIGLGHEQSQASAHGHPRRLEPRHLGPVAADARALDDDVAAEQRVEASLPGGQDVEPVDGGHAGGVVDQDGHAAHGSQSADAGAAFDAQPPDADRRVSERGPGDRWAHSDPGCDGAHAARAAPRPRHPPRA